MGRVFRGWSCLSVILVTEKKIAVAMLMLFWFLPVKLMSRLPKQLQALPTVSFHAKVSPRAAET